MTRDIQEESAAFRAELLHTQQSTLELIAYLVHSIRNKLADAQISLSRLDQLYYYLPDEKRHEHPALAERLSDSLNSISTDIDSVRGLYQDNYLETSFVNLRDLIEDVFRALRSAFEKNFIHVRIVGYASCRVFPAPLRHVFLNLALNSIRSIEKYKKKRGREIVVYVSKSDDGRTSVVRYTDSGIAAAKFTTQDANRMFFEPGFTTEKGGTGYGLVLVRRIIDMHGGSIDVVDTKHGVTFDISIPDAEDNK